MLGSGGIMYNSGNIVSGPLDSLVNLLMPFRMEDLDQVKAGSHFKTITLIFESMYLNKRIETYRARLTLRFKAYKIESVVFDLFFSKLKL